jgi:hypothetical protein
LQQPFATGRFAAVLKLFGIWLPWLVAVLIAVQLTRWGGLPRTGLLTFWLGVSTVILVALSLLLVGRRLLLAPPADEVAAASRPEQDRLLAALLLLSGFAIGVGAFWDEIWHRQYGLPFGEDLFWRPHLLMYSGLLGVIVLAGGAFVVALRAGSRRLWRRLRARPPLVLLMLLGAFLLYALPADPAWHALYGGDISAWSLPHLLLALNFSAIALVAVALMRSADPTPPWHGLRRAVASDAFAVVAFALALNLLLQLLTTEWDSVRFIPVAAAGPFWDRPPWVLPGLLAALAALVGTLAIRASRLIGAATLTGALALALRWLLLQAFGFDQASTDAWLLLFPPLIALDLLFWLHRQRGVTPRWWRSGVAVAVGTAAGTLPLLEALLVYPRVDLAGLPAMLVAILLCALGAAWAGDRLGGRLAAGFRTGPLPPPVRPLRRWPLAVAALLAVAFVSWFIVSAPSPG